MSSGEEVSIADFAHQSTKDQECASDNTKRKSRVLPIALLIALVVLALSITLGVVFSNKNKEDDGQSKSTTIHSTGDSESAANTHAEGSSSSPTPAEAVSDPGNPGEANYVFRVDTLAPSPPNRDATTTDNVEKSPAPTCQNINGIRCIPNPVAPEEIPLPTSQGTPTAQDISNSPRATEETSLPTSQGTSTSPTTTDPKKTMAPTTGPLDSNWTRLDPEPTESPTPIVQKEELKQETVLQLNCPTELESSLEFTMGSVEVFRQRQKGSDYWIQLFNSNPNTLCTLVQVGTNQEGSYIMPMARSYSGHPWEVSAGKYKDTLQITDCRKDHCRLNLNVIHHPTEAVFQLTTFGRPNYSNRDEIARFLEQTTFGQTTELIDEIAAQGSNLQSSFANWIQTQMNETEVPIMSHRALYRRHLNARFNVPSPIGTVTQPCQAGTRYRRMAFSNKDIDRSLDIQYETDDRIVLSVDGQLRTVVQAPLFYWDSEFVELDWPEGSHRICWVYYDGERSGISVEHPERNNECLGMVFKDLAFRPILYPTYWTNPPVAGIDSLIDWSEQITVLNIPSDAAAVVDEELFPLEDIMPKELEVILLADLEDMDCANLKPADNEHPVFALWNGSYYIHDPRFVLRENTMDNPLPDGGGTIAGEHGNLLLDEFSTMCANAPRTFLNEHQCVLSDEACRYRTTEEDLDGPEAWFQVTRETIRAVYEATRDTATPVYLYAIDGLDVTRDASAASPCEPGQMSRWTNVPCSNADDGITDVTRNLVSMIINWHDDMDQENPNLLDVWHPHRFDKSCDPAEMDRKGFEVPDSLREERCWKNVHPDHLSVYNFAPWVDSHPGNSEARNPIREIAEAGSTTLVFPSWHEMSRWQNVKDQFPNPIRLGDWFNFFDLPIRLRTEEIASALGVDIDSASTTKSVTGEESTMVCGSPFEVSNNPFFGGSTWGGAFDAATKYLQTTSFENLMAQRQTAWIRAALEDPGQLRQRVAWALSQILVISPGSISEGEELTEAFLMFYDIMVRHAFGNYRDILKEVSYSPMMADMLTYYGGRSTAHVWQHEGNIEFADENYAREIMQLFTTGAFTKLHRNGTAILNDEGAHERVYSNDDIEEYARAWTGFVSHEGRGNSEFTYTNRIDPMRINEEWRDPYPKMGLDRTYIGDGFPLCSDLPAKHFLTKGASYRLLGSKSIPELQMDPAEWREGDSMDWIELETGSPLYGRLCGAAEGSSCIFPSIVVLDQTLECFGGECAVDTIRTVKINGVFYEYARKACVQQAFFDQAKIVLPRWDSHNVMCADPRTESGSVACCAGSDWSLDKWGDEYFGERVSFATAKERCGGEDTICKGFRRPACDDEVVGTRCFDNDYFWTSNPCTLKAKIDKQSGKIGIVHGPIGLDSNNVAPNVHADTKTFFRVDWDGDFQALLTDCGAFESCVETEDGACLCEVSVSEEQVFFGDSLPNLDEILSGLRIGAFEQHGSAVAASAGDVNAYNLGEDGLLQADSVFAVVDEYGRRHWRKNLKSKVLIAGTDVSFRNPVHFISLSDAEPRDAHYETDATLDSYIYHPNTAPFLALRFAQRFGISNPSPRYIDQISTAFGTGSYAFVDEDGNNLNFGSGEYGDLSSTFACILLDREARDVILDNDPAHGALKEPLVKVLGLMRALKFKPNKSHPLVQFDSNFGDRIGQMAHEIPSVFSFFLPQYIPSGLVARGSLVSPEAQVLTGPRVISSLNGIFAMIKYGLNDCHGGIGTEIADCNSVDLQSGANTGELTYELPADIKDAPELVVKELATLLTAGRLGPENRRLIEQVYGDGGSHALMKAHLLMAAAPEFHMTNLIKQNGFKRPSLPAASAASKPYKAVVYVLLEGGVDSFNMLAPHMCTTVNSNGMNLLEQYNRERTTIAFTDEERFRIIDAEGQPCEQFAIHQDLPLIERLYNDGELSFFANVGQLDLPVTKDNYWMTRTDLFAHNTMQRQAQRIDPWEEFSNTGILGRMCDALLQRGFNCQSITIDDATVATVGGVAGTSVSPLIVSKNGLDKFAPNTANETFDLNDYIADLINATDVHSSMFGETWARTLQKAIADAEQLRDAIRNVELTQNYPMETEGDYAKKAKALSSLLLTHEERGADRDVFFLSLGDWDHHEALKPSLSREFTRLNQALTLLEGEIKAQGLWEQVTVVVTSDFARTLTANSGEGSDHAWGGNYFVMGGEVKGGRIHGDYPADITLNGPLNVGRGRLIPTLSWESMLNSAVQWMGLESDEELDYCMPNRNRTETPLFSIDDVFESTLDSARFLRRQRG